MVALPPTVLIQLAKSTVSAQYDLTSVRSWGTGAAPLTSETATGFGKRFNDATMNDGKRFFLNIFMPALISL